MQQVIRLSKQVDLETTKGVVARTIYEESEIDNLARTLALQNNKKVVNSYWDGSTAGVKEYVVEDLPPLEASEPVPAVVEQVAETCACEQSTEEADMACKGKGKGTKKKGN